MSAVRFAVATTMALAATSANALDISTYAGNAATNINLFLSGSSSVDNTLLLSEIATASPGGICAANTIDVYQIGAPSQRMTYCSAASGLSGITAGTPLAIFKESMVGAINGVTPLIAVAKGQPSGLRFISPAALITAGGDSDCTTSTVPATANFSAYTLHSACAGSIMASNVVPTGGISDVEAALLRTVPGNGNVPAQDVSSLLSGFPVSDVVWAVVVTKNLYYALQAAEHLTDGTRIAACNVANNDQPTCAPSLSKAQVASLYLEDGLLNWNQIVGVSNPVDNSTYICRESMGSGAEGSIEAYFLSARCGSSSEVTAPQDGQFVFTNSSSGNMRSCLQAFFSGGAITPFNGDFNTNFTPVTEPGGQWAIGFLSTEITSRDVSAAGDSFRVIAVDGVLPTLANVANGFWPYFSTDVFYTVAAGKPNAPTGVPLAAFRALQGKVGHPAFTAITNSAYINNGGDLAPASLFAISNQPAIPATSSTVKTNPTNVYTKSSSLSVNNCDTPVLFNNTTANGPQNTVVESILLGNGNVNN